MLLVEGDNDSSSLDNNCLHSSVSESSSFESEDNELVVQPTQTNKMSQKMAFEVCLAHLQILNNHLWLFRDRLGHLLPQRALWMSIYHVILRP
jgi:hypothetical protein